ncbi:hypothetical protein BBJ29_002447 [Phytophthora kernoviae]|uniref:Uncharacterized protein n=1 Tax=Phytophthora kernoviae TaxID=325452 RepID=A0A3R7K6J9_9STRA|nr:hypothetical protein BBJ29_002447 [Phytophthora kernoviae]
MMRVLQNDVKRLSFDELHTLSFVFFSKRAASRWILKALRFQKAAIVFKDTTRRLEEEGTGHYTAAQLEVQYAIRIYGGGKLGLVALARAFARFSEAKVLDVEYARASLTEIYDNRYHTIRFAQTTCPLPLNDSDSDHDDADAMELDDVLHEAAHGDDDAQYAFTEGNGGALKTDYPMAEAETQYTKDIDSKEEAILPTTAKGKADVTMVTEDTTGDEEWPNATQLPFMSLHPPEQTTSLTVTSTLRAQPSAKSQRRKKQHEGKIGLQEGAIKGTQTSMTNYMQ